jgi:hypothetical protein
VTTLAPKPAPRPVSPDQSAALKAFVAWLGDLARDAACWLAEAHAQCPEQRRLDSEAVALRACFDAGRGVVSATWQHKAREAVRSAAACDGASVDDEPWAAVAEAANAAVLALVAPELSDAHRTDLLAPVEAGGFQIEVPQ